MRAKAPWIAGAGLLLLVAIQAVPVERTNPPGRAAPDAPAPVADALRRACFDCHSNQTVWPWYSRVAPASWLVAHDVKEGREKLNFSTWQTLAPAQQAKAMKKAWEQIAEGEMPPWYYLPLHPGARLTAQDRAELRAWLLRPGPPASAGE